MWLAALAAVQQHSAVPPCSQPTQCVVCFHSLACATRQRRSLRGLLFRCVGLGLQLSVLGVIIGARADEKWYRLLAGGYAAARLCISCTHTIIAYTIPHARRLSVVNAAAGLALAVAPAVMALLEQDEEAYVSHVKVIAATAVGERLATAMLLLL